MHTRFFHTEQNHHHREIVYQLLLRTHKHFHSGKHMFEKFSDRAIKVVASGQEEANRLLHNYIGSEHILLGILNQKSDIATTILEEAGVSSEKILIEIRKNTAQETEESRNEISFSEDCEKLLSMSTYIAEQLCSQYIDVEHLLLGIFSGQHTATKILLTIGINLRALTNDAHYLITEQSRHQSAGSLEAVDFSKLTQKATLTIEQAGEEASQIGCEFINPEHILLGLMHENTSIAAAILTAIGADLGDIRTAVGRYTARAQNVVIQEAHISLMMKSVLQRASMSSKQLGKERIDTDDLLIASMETDPHRFSKIFEHLNVQPNLAMQEVSRRIEEKERNNENYWCRKGIFYYEREQFKESIDFFNKALEIGPNDSAEAWFYRGRAFENLGHMRSALDNYSQALTFIPNEPQILFQKNFLLQQEFEEYEAALEGFRSALEIEPRNIRALNHAAISFWRLNAFDKAMEYFNRALRINPEFHSARLNRASLLESLGRREEALEELEIIVRAVPEDSLAWNFRGDLLKWDRKFVEAIDSYNCALEVDKLNFDVWMSKGYLLIASKGSADIVF